MDDLALLMALRVQGLATAERAACASGLDVDAAASRLGQLLSDALVKERTGKRSGFSLTPDGIAHLDKLLAAEGLRTSEALSDSYDRFLMMNKRVIALCSDWQVRRDGGIETPNDHTDRAYDTDVIERLVALHERAKSCMENLAEAGRRFAPYKDRFAVCVERLQAGDRDAFTAVLAESYHTVWFELHQDLLLTLGLEREV